MKKTTASVVLLLFLLAPALKAQTWPKMILPDKSIVSLCLIKSYDYGLLFGGWFDVNNCADNGVIFKTDINGVLLWYKTLGLSKEGIGINSICQTSDGGYIITGCTQQYNPFGETFIMKLNSCMDNEWCKIYRNSDDKPSSGKSVYQIPGGYIALIYKGNALYDNDHIELRSLDNFGETIWDQTYIPADPKLIGTNPYDMILTPDYHLLVSGFCYYPDSTKVSPLKLRPYLVKVDTNGTLEFEMPVSRINGSEYYGMFYRSILDNQNNIFSCGRDITSTGDRISMVRSDSTGHGKAFYDLITNTSQAVAFNLNWLQDSTIEIDGGWMFNQTNVGPVGVFRLNRNGTILDSVTLLNSLYCFSDAVVTSDNQIALVSPQYSTIWNTYFWKLNADLTPATLNTSIITYDSVCPHAIASDTILLDCEIVGVDETPGPEKSASITVFPNPASEKITLTLPDEIVITSALPGMSVQTAYHQWRSATLEIYDLFGKRIFSREIPQQQKTLELNLTSWHSGLYVARLLHLNRVVATTKFVVK
jgi:hypothetical protein